MKEQNRKQTFGENRKNMET